MKGSTTLKGNRYLKSHTNKTDEVVSAVTLLDPVMVKTPA